MPVKSNTCTKLRVFSFALSPSALVYGMVGVTCIAISPVSVTAQNSSFTPRVSPMVSIADANPLISLTFSKAQVGDVLSMIAREGGIDIAMGEDVTGIVQNLRLTDKTPEQALKIVAQTIGLSWKKVDSRTYIVNKIDRSRIENTDSSPLSSANITEMEIANADVDFVIGVKPKTARVEKETVSIAIQNVKPNVMAYWIDPLNQPKPVEFQKSDERQQLQSKEFMTNKSATANDLDGSNIQRPNGMYQAPSNSQYGNGTSPDYQPYARANRQFGGSGGSTGGSGGTGGGGTGTQGVGQSLLAPGAATVALPEGVDNIIAIDSQNVLLVRGTDEGIDRIREIIALLDKPITQVEIEAKFVTVSTSANDTFDLSLTNSSGGGVTTLPNTVDFGASSSTGGIGVAFTRGNFSASLQAAISSGRARVVQAPRVTTFNNLTAQIVQVRTQTIVTTETIVFPGTNGNPSFTQTFQRFTTIPEGIVLTVIPTVHRDGTITISLQPIVQATTPSGTTSPFPNVISQEINTSANVKDGDTLAIGGLRSGRTENSKGRIPILGSLPLIGGLFRSKVKNQSDTELLIFVTARVVRRIEDPVPGT